MRITFTTIAAPLLAGTCALATACRDDAPAVTRRVVAREARRPELDPRPPHRDDRAFTVRRDEAVARSRTSLAAIDQEIAALETYRDAGVGDDARADRALDRVREQRKLAAAALEDLAIADAADWDTRRIALEKAFADLDASYKDARAAIASRSAR